MKIAVLSDVDGRLIGIAPVHNEVEGGPVGRIVAQQGQVLHEIEVADEILANPERVARLHETHRVSAGRLVES
ncbi:hypothetical protein [Kutzneria chonburiensis]|uniref:Uncharacterized protein n=1 Tax=Kutzneria chonburiensis TaxID=1483604 RepID=A0ABV6MR93_9PSEU|nr:hypothetical protein [Kutzneria chonburiensis]